jgi:hypothetical protein
MEGLTSNEAITSACLEDGRRVIATNTLYSLTEKPFF